MTVYKVLRIEEDIDFGCEERPEGAPVLAVLTLQNEEGEQRILRYPDRELYRLQINDGDRVLWDPDFGTLKKWSERMDK